MDINDISSMQPDAAAESTLESEIDALSKIITDTKDSIKKLEDTDDDFKLNSEDLAFATNLQCDSLEKDKLLSNDKFGIKSILDNTGQIKNFISTSITKSSLQQISNETLKLINDIKENKDTNLKLKEQIQDSENFTISSENISQTDEIESLSGTELCKVNNSLLLISEAYSSQESQSYSESQSVSISEIEEVIESVNITYVDIKEDLNSDLNDFESIDRNEVEASSSVSKKVDRLKKKLDTEITEKCVIQNLVKQNNGNVSSEPDLVQTLNLSRKDCFTIDHLNDNEEKNCNLNTNNQKEEKANKMILELDNLNKKEKNDIEQQGIPSVIKIDIAEATKDSFKEFINEGNQIESAINIEVMQQQNEKCKQNFENTIVDKKKVIKLESCLVLASNDEQNYLCLEKLDENDKQESINITDSININNETIKKIDINMKYKKILSENVVDEKNIQMFQDINLGTNIDFSVDTEKKRNFKPLQNIDIHTITLQDAETLKTIKHLENANLNLSIKSSQEKDITDFMQKIEPVNVIKPSQNIKILENSNIVIDSKLSQIPKIISNNEKSEEIKNIEAFQNIIATSVNQSFKNTDTDNNIKGLQCLKSVKVHIKNENTKGTIENFENETIISTKVDLVNETEISSEILFSVENNKNVGKSICKSNNKIKRNEKIFTNLELLNKGSSNKHTYQIANKDLLEFKNINDQAVETLEINELKELDNESSVKHSLITIKQAAIENISLIKVEDSEDLNIRLDVEKSETLEKMNPIKKEEIFEAKSKNNTSVKIDTQEKLIQKVKKKVKDEIETNLSLNVNKYNLATSQYLSEEQIKLNNSLEELPVNENDNVAEVPNTSETEDPDFNEILDINQKVDEVISDNQSSDLQEHTSNVLNDVEKGFNSNLNKLLETEEHVNKEVIHFIESESSNLAIRSIQSLDEKLQDSLSLLDDLHTESISTKQKQKQIKEFETIEKDEDIALIFEESNQSPGQIQNDTFINDLYNSCAPDDTIENNDIELENIQKFNKQNNKNNVKKEDTLNKNITNTNISVDIESNIQLETLEDESTIFSENQLVMEKSTEISELESAVKYLQESEEQGIIKDPVNEENSSIFVSVEDSVCDNVSELVSDLQEVTDPIAISEAEIISEAAKLESEHKEKLELEQNLKNSIQESHDSKQKMFKTINASNPDNLLTNIESNKELNILQEVPNKNTLKAIVTTKSKVTSESSLTVSILEDPPKIEIPEISSKIGDLPSSPKTSLLIHKEAKRRLESPDRAMKNMESKISDTAKKDSDKQQQQQQCSECDNVGSPRIILKIAKSAIAECSEPRSPKSPKIRSAANSPNPEDSPGQKLGKIKLKLSKGGHPSIIPNTDNYDDTTQWHADSSSSLSPLGVRIKLTKSADTSSLENKYEEDQKQEELKEKTAYKTEEIRKTEASIGMKIKLSKSGDASIVHQDGITKDNIIQEISTIKKQDSPLIGMKIKLSKFGDASIIQQDTKNQFIDEMVAKPRDKIVEEIQDSMRRIESPIGMKIKFSKSGDASVIASEPSELEKETSELKDKTEQTNSPMGVKIKLAKIKSGGASIITSESPEEVKEKLETMEILKKTKLSKKREAETIETKEKVESDVLKQELNKAKILKITIGESDTGLPSDILDENSKVSIGMKIKLSKIGDGSLVQMKKEDSSIEASNKASDQPIGMKIKFSKTGGPSIVHSETSTEAEDLSYCAKTKHSKNKDNSSTCQQKSKDDSHIEMKIKLSKTGHPTIITTNETQEDPLKITNVSIVQSHKHKDLLTFKESTIKTFKSHSDVSIALQKSQSIENAMIDLHNKRKEITIAPIESKKLKIETNFKQMLPDVTIQPILSGVKREQSQQKLLLESNSGSISRQQMNVINQEISITQICSLATGDTLMGERLQSAVIIQNEPSIPLPLNSDCEIIEPQPELIIVNENSNSSQDIMIIDEVPPKFAMKMPKKRGRPRRNASTVGTNLAGISSFQEMEFQRDPLSLEQSTMPIAMPMPSSLPIPMPVPMLEHQMQSQIGTGSSEGTERPRRTCRSQKSYAPPKRGRGRGRGKRKNDAVDIPSKKQRIEQDLTAIENSTTTVISLEKFSVKSSNNENSSPELFKALNQPTLERSAKQMKEVDMLVMSESTQTSICQQKACKEVQHMIKDLVEITTINTETSHSTEIATSTISRVSSKNSMEECINKAEVIIIKVTEEDEKQSEIIREETEVIDHKDSMTIQEHKNWLAPSIRKVSNESTTRNESISTLTVIDEETRMSAESGSRSQTPARAMIVPGTSETLVNDESQGSVLSTATTESEKVKVKNRRMEISFDPDEGPFTVEKIAEYEWPLEKKDDRPAGRGETFMIQEQISQYLGVKSFKRKYPDLKRRMVDMEERNFLRENGLVSESMCDMGLTAVSSSEVLDIMCSDFPEQYEEYRKHMREKAAKEHSKKQKELSAAANAERNRIDLAEMAMQSALSWNSCLNKARQDSRKCSLDLQTFTVHMPKHPIKLDSLKRTSHYPVALIPGQYTDYYREYTPAELRYYPLNTVLYGPMRPNERKFDSQSEDSQSDSDSDSSTDDSSSSSSEGTQNTEGSQSMMDEVDMELVLQPDVKCKMCLNNFNKNNRPEVLIQCGTCSGNVHPSCIDLTLDMVPHIRAYAWQCTDCKTCAQCHDPADEDKMLFCDMCDRGYHIYCVGLRRVPQGRWHCQECAICANCGSKEPGGINSDRNSVAQWQHEYKKGDKNTRVYVSTFCVPCSKLWRKGRYCPHCSRCHNAPRLDLEANLVHCGVCDKYLHLDCVETKGQIIDKKRYFCEFCSSNRQQLTKPLLSKTFKT